MSWESAKEEALSILKQAKVLSTQTTLAKALAAPLPQHHFEMTLHNNSENSELIGKCSRKW